MAFTNSPLVTYTNLTKNKTIGRNGQSIDTITIHCFVGQVTAKSGCDYFATTDRECSSNYVVGHDGSIGLSVEEKNRSWATGGSYTVNGTTGSQNDYHAVTIEVACESYHPYEVTPQAYKALIKLVADIAKRNGIGKLIWKNDKSLVGKPKEQNMTIHAWFADKSCPGKYLRDRLGDIAKKANEINGYSNTKPAPAPAPVVTKFKSGDLVKITGNKYYNGESIPNWVKNQNWYVHSVKGNRVVINKNEAKTNAIMSPIDAKYLRVVKRAPAAQKPANELKVGDKVKMTNGAPVYGRSTKYQSWVYKATLYVREISGDRVVVSTLKTGAVTGPVHKKYLTKV